MKGQIVIDPKVPREALYQSFAGQPGPCPKCGSELHMMAQTYMVATREGDRLADSFIIGGDFGWFCKSCPVVVINMVKVGEMLSFRKRGWDIGAEFLVLGIVNLDAVPASKRHLPIGAPGNPVPLVKFRNLAASTSGKGIQNYRRRTRQRK